MSTLPGAASAVLAVPRTEMIALLTAVLLVIPRDGGCILTKADPEREANATTDNVPQQSIARGFSKFPGGRGGGADKTRSKRSMSLAAFGEDGHVGYGAGYGGECRPAVTAPTRRTLY